MRADSGAPWVVLAAGASLVEAQAVVDKAGALNGRGRIVVAQAVRSFQIAPATTEDSIATIDP